MERRCDGYSHSRHFATMAETWSRKTDRGPDPSGRRQVKETRPGQPTRFTGKKSKSLLVEFSLILNICFLLHVMNLIIMIQLKNRY